MTTKPPGKKATYTRHSTEYKQEALKLATQLGIAKAANQLGLHESQLYNWRKDSEHAHSVSKRESSLAAENVRLKRQLAQQAEELSILKNAATYFAQQLKRGTNT
ncbi:MAG: transposase [Thiothrix sp.]|uniref:transposase n=1 Tax=Thiothrix sp. TaxID=1032 RepID=UPI002615035D|nr:transposase [Thiothrix sp.]MDD5392910.1 transposase [Thiothrix sp.]